MKLWLISQTEHNDYDTYDSAVVAAETEEAARITHPSGDTYRPKSDDWSWSKGDYTSRDWARKSANVSVKLIGEAIEGTEAGPICSSFNAG
jgi:hypothetical protein